MKAALLVETLKLRRSLVGIIATLAIVGGTIALLGGLTAALAGGNPEVTAKAGSGASLDWTGLLSTATQITSAGALLGFGVVLSWMFAREFTDGTITGLFALPVSRGRIAIAKFVVYATWVTVVAVTLTGCVLMLGLILGYGVPDDDAWAAIGRQLVLVVLTGAVAAPTAWVATVSRSLLAGLGCTIGLVGHSSGQRSGRGRRLDASRCTCALGDKRRRGGHDRTTPTESRAGAGVLRADPRELGKATNKPLT